MIGLVLGSLVAAIQCKEVEPFVAEVGQKFAAKGQYAEQTILMFEDCSGIEEHIRVSLQNLGLFQSWELEAQIEDELGGSGYLSSALNEEVKTKMRAMIV